MEADESWLLAEGLADLQGDRETRPRSLSHAAPKCHSSQDTETSFL